MAEQTIAVVVPTFGAFDYAARAVRSAAAKTWHRLLVVVVDDASPGFGDPAGDWRLLDDALAACPRKVVVRFPSRGGLTRSWNEGLRRAREHGCALACCTNSDVLFSSGWDLPLAEALAAGGGPGLVGPVTNAPGTERAQCVRRYEPGYRLTDEPAYLDALGEKLHDAHGARFVRGPLNGFCLVAKTAVWWAHAHDAANVFRPRNDLDSKGRPNPTPLMTLNEYELQRRWADRGVFAAHCPGSFVLHYRAVSRGPRHRTDGWLRAGTP